jgi:hypothetical protein
VNTHKNNISLFIYNTTYGEEHEIILDCHNLDIGNIKEGIRQAGKLLEGDSLKPLGMTLKEEGRRVSR